MAGLLTRSGFRTGRIGTMHRVEECVAEYRRQLSPETPRPTRPPGAAPSTAGRFRFTDRPALALDLARRLQLLADLGTISRCRPSASRPRSGPTG